MTILEKYINNVLKNVNKRVHELICKDDVKLYVETRIRKQLRVYNDIKREGRYED